VLPSKGEQFFLQLLLTIFEDGKSWEHLRTVRLANSKARIKLTAPLSVFDKENLIEFLLDFSTLLIQLLHSLCTSFPHLSCDLSCDIML